jgi:hypothetical protein
MAAMPCVDARKASPLQPVPHHTILMPEGRHRRFFPHRVRPAIDACVDAVQSQQRACVDARDGAWTCIPAGFAQQTARIGRFASAPGSLRTAFAYLSLP